MELPKKLIDKWKKRYGQIQMISIKGDNYIFRRLTKGEMDIVKREKVIYKQDLLLIKIGLLWCSIIPKDGSVSPYTDVDLSKMPSMAPITLKIQILKCSGFAAGADDLNKTITEKREQYNTLQTQMTIFILRAFPTLTPAHVDEMFYDEFIEYFVLAEKVLQKELEFDPTKIGDKIIINPLTGHKTLIKDLKKEVNRKKKELGIN